MSLTLKRTLLTASALAFSCLFMFNAQAGIVSNSLDPVTAEPDISSADIDVMYNFNGVTGIGTLTAVGNAVELTNGGVSTALDAMTGAGAFNINATIDTNDNSATGSLSIGGMISSFSFNSGTLLTGALKQVGGPSTALNFLFDVTGGDASGLYGNTAGVIIGFSNFNTTASFTSNFRSGDALFGFDVAIADTFKVPAPYTLPLFLLGLCVLGLRSKNRA